MLWFSLSESKVYATILGITIPQYFVHPSNKLLPAIVIGSHMEEKQLMYRLKSLKEKTISLCVNS